MPQGTLLSSEPPWNEAAGKTATAIATTLSARLHPSIQDDHDEHLSSPLPTASTRGI